MIARWLHAFAQRAWYPREAPGRDLFDAIAAAASLALAPAGWLVGAVARRRRDSRRSTAAGLPPIIVVGNLVAGGAGKTPLVIALAQLLGERGTRVGIVCRGHGGTTTATALHVRPDTDPALAGDEAVLLARACACPVVAGRDRLAAVRSLVERHDPALVISDDGLQHVALPRAFEFVVVDARARFGNGRCLPAGPLREPADAEALRESAVPTPQGGVAGTRRCLVIRGDPTHSAAAAAALGLTAPIVMDVVPADLRPLEATSNRPVSLGWLEGRPVHAVCGIGRPERFFAALAALGAEVVEHAFADHHVYVAGDLEFGDALPVVMTAKDAVKCERLEFTARARSCVLDVVPVFNRSPLSPLTDLLPPLTDRETQSR